MYALSVYYFDLGSKDLFSTLGYSGTRKNILSKCKCSDLNGGAGGRSKTYQGLRN